MFVMLFEKTSILVNLINGYKSWNIFHDLREITIMRLIMAWVELLDASYIFISNSTFFTILGLNLYL